jgi:hypothetical protein
VIPLAEHHPGEYADRSVPSGEQVVIEAFRVARTSVQPTAASADRPEPGCCIASRFRPVSG